MTAETKRTTPFKRRVLLLLVIATGVVVVLQIRDAYRPVLNVTAFAGIRPGMTEAEVSALLGGPPGDYDPRGTTA